MAIKGIDEEYIGPCWAIYGYMGKYNAHMLIYMGPFGPWAPYILRYSKPNSHCELQLAQGPASRPPIPYFWWLSQNWIENAETTWDFDRPKQSPPSKTQENFLGTHLGLANENSRAESISRAPLTTWRPSAQPDPQAVPQKTKI